MYIGHDMYAITFSHLMPLAVARWMPMFLMLVNLHPTILNVSVTLMQPLLHTTSEPFAVQSAI